MGAFDPKRMLGRDGGSDLFYKPQMLGSVVTGQGLTKVPPGRRVFFVGLMVLALVAQGFTLQTHIHKQGFASTSIALKVVGSTGHDKVPVTDDPANCPTCLQILHAGQFIAPGWLLPFLLIVAVSTIEIATAALPHYDAVSHSWQSRAPPRR